MQTLEEGELQRAVQRANQDQACVAQLPASTMSLFQGPRAGVGRGEGARGGGLMGARTKLATGQMFWSTCTGVTLD